MYLVGLLWPGAPRPLQGRVCVVAALLVFPLPALLLLPAALAAGGVACQLHLIQVTHLHLSIRVRARRECRGDGCFLCSVLGLVAVVWVDCAAPWRLQVNPALRWFHFIHPLMLLLLYNTIASLWRNQVTPAPHSQRSPRGRLADGSVSLQLIAAAGEQDAEGAESGISGSCDIMTATSNLSDEVSGELTAEGRREMWRRAHHSPRSTGVHKQDLQSSAGAEGHASPEGAPVCAQVTEPSANDSPSECEAQPTESTALGLDLYSPHHYSLSQSGW